jgi:hypothetical protein
MHLSIYHNAVLTAAISSAVILPEPGAITVAANVIIVEAS